MTDLILSRFYLQNLPAKAKQEEFEQMIRGFTRQLQEDARDGKTSCRFPMTNLVFVSKPDGNARIMQARPSNHTTIPFLELLNLFKEKFHLCDVHYEEEWVNDTPTSKYLKKGIIIDWS
jgi:hypothetical protein